MAIKIIAIGKTDSGFIKVGLEEYLGRIKRYIKLEWKELPDIKRSSKFTESLVKEKEAELILKEISTRTHLLLMDEGGKTFSSEQFASFLEKKLVDEPDIALVIGGAYGFSEEIYQRANGKLSLSKMTFSHQMVRVFLAEQMYRAFTILRGEPYHHR